MRRWSLRGGVTLLELLLAMSLSIAVLTAVTMAISLYFKMLEVRRTSLEEMQVVRVVTQKMTDDIRMLVPHNEPDLSGLETAMNNAMQAATKQAAAATGTTAVSIGPGGVSTGNAATSGTSGGGANQTGSGQGNQAGGGGQGTGGGNQGGQGSSASTTGSTGAAGSSTAGATGAKAGAAGSSNAGGSATSSSTASSTATATEETAAPPVVQLVGTATELRFDISRLPRVDQYKGIMTQSGEFAATDLPSDVKTIVYFLRNQQSADSYADDPRALGGEASTDGYGRGLMRAEMDRAVTVYSDGDSSGALAYTRAQLLANEVVGLGFEYFDGLEWLTEWDSTSSSSLPRAIRVWLSVKPTYGMSEQELIDANKGAEVPTTDFYFVISVPTSPLVAASTTEEAEAASDASSSSSSTGSSAASPM